MTEDEGRKDEVSEGIVPGSHRHKDEVCPLVSK